MQASTLSQQSAGLAAAFEGVSDEAVVKRVLAGEPRLFEVLMRRHNQRLYRLAYSVLRDDQEARDIMQESYLKTFEQLSRFRGDARFGTWLARIALHAAWARARHRQRFKPLDDDAGGTDGGALAPDPASEAANRELREKLSRAIARLPAPLRLVFVAREVEGMSTNECAACLEISELNVKVRLFRARARLRIYLSASIGPEVRQLLTFGFSRCDALVMQVLDVVTRKVPLDAHH